MGIVTKVGSSCFAVFFVNEISAICDFSSRCAADLLKSCYLCSI